MAATDYTDPRVIQERLRAAGQARIPPSPDYRASIANSAPQTIADMPRLPQGSPADVDAIRARLSGANASFYDRPINPQPALDAAKTAGRTVMQAAAPVLKWGGRLAGAAGAAGEAASAAQDVGTPGMTGIDKGGRVAEGVGRLAGAGVGAAKGAAFGSALGPVGAAVGGIGGGIAGYFAPDIVNNAANALPGIASLAQGGKFVPGTNQLPSDRAAQLRAVAPPTPAVDPMAPIKTPNGWMASPAQLDAARKSAALADARTAATPAAAVPTVAAQPTVKPAARPKLTLPKKPQGQAGAQMTAPTLGTDPTAQGFIDAALGPAQQPQSIADVPAPMVAQQAAQMPRPVAWSYGMPGDANAVAQLPDGTEVRGKEAAALIKADMQWQRDNWQPTPENTGIELIGPAGQSKMAYFNQTPEHQAGVRRAAALDAARGRLMRENPQAFLLPGGEGKAHQAIDAGFLEGANPGPVKHERALSLENVKGEFGLKERDIGAKAQTASAAIGANASMRNADVNAKTEAEKLAHVRKTSDRPVPVTLEDEPVFDTQGMFVGMRKRGQVLWDPVTGSYKEPPAPGGATQKDMNTDPRAAAIKANTKMSREEQKAALKKLGY